MYSLTADNFSKLVCILLGDTTYKGTPLYKEINNAIDDLNAILNPKNPYTFKKKNKKTNKCYEIGIPYEISNLFAAFVALKNEFKTFDMITRNNIGKKDYSKFKHPTDADMSEEQIDRLTCFIDIDEVTSFILKTLQYLKNNLSEIETVAFINNFYHTDSNDSFKMYDELIMLQKQYEFFFKTVCENYNKNINSNKDSIKIISEMRLYLQKYTYNIQFFNKHKSESERLFANSFANIYEKIRDTIAYSIDDILSRTHDKKNERINFSDSVSEEFKNKHYREFKTYYDILEGNKPNKRSINKLNKLYEDYLAEITDLYNPISIYQSTDFRDFNDENINKLFANVFDCVERIINIEVNALIRSDILRYETYTKRKNALRDLYHLTDLYNLYAIDKVLDKFYEELENADLSNYEEFIVKQIEIAQERINDIKKNYKDYWTFYKKDLVKANEDQRFSNKNIESILYNVCKKEKDVLDPENQDPAIELSKTLYKPLNREFRKMFPGFSPSIEPTDLYQQFRNKDGIIDSATSVDILSGKINLKK